MTSTQYRQQIQSYLAKQFNLGSEQISEMLPSFITTLSGHMANLEEALKSGNLENLGKSGHTIKGAFLNLGLADCAEIAFQIEQGGKSQDQSVDFPGLIATLRDNIDAIAHDS
jgi:HPt (histidine-containing phosphotransfer) domain-containing protein